MPEKVPFYEKIKIFDIEKVPDNDTIFNKYVPEWHAFIGYYIFKLTECIDPECVKKGKLFVGTLNINFYISGLCIRYLKGEISESELIPYLLN